jgi:hypothetical protein
LVGELFGLRDERAFALRDVLAGLAFPFVLAFGLRDPLAPVFLAGRVFGFAFLGLVLVSAISLLL